MNHVPICTQCGYPGVRSEQYDSYFCPRCHLWLEPKCKCGGDDCEWFPGRPDKPPEDTTQKRTQIRVKNDH